MLVIVFAILSDLPHFYFTLRYSGEEEEAHFVVKQSTL